MRCSRSAGSTGATCSAREPHDEWVPSPACASSNSRPSAPAPSPGMMLADMGADVILVDRPARCRARPEARAARSTSCCAAAARSTLDLKSAGGAEAALRLIEKADALIEGFRPGVMERLGLGPDACPCAQPAAGLRPHDRLGPGRAARRARRPRHQLHRARRRAERHRPRRRSAGAAAQSRRRLRRRRHAARVRHRLRPDRGAHERPRPGRRRGDGRRRRRCWRRCSPASSPRASGSETRGANWLDSGAPWYDTYATSDGKHVAIGAIEPQVLRRAARSTRTRRQDAAATQHDRAAWPALRSLFAARFATRTRDEWCATFDGSDACFAPVLSFAESRRASRTSRRVQVASISAASPSRHRRRASVALPAASSALHPSAARAAPKRCATGASTRRESSPYAGSASPSPRQPEATRDATPPAYRAATSGPRPRRQVRRRAASAGAR